MLTEVELADNEIVKYGKSISGNEGKQVAVIPVIMGGKVLPPRKLPPIGTGAKDLRVACYFIGEKATYAGQDLILDHFMDDVGVWISNNNKYYTVSVVERNSEAVSVISG